jgi:hypothetical protein
MRPERIRRISRPTRRVGAQRPGGGGPAPFNPADMSNRWFWYDASDATTVTKTGDRIDTMTNKFPESRTLSRAGGTPTHGVHTQNGLPLIRSASSEGYLNHDAGAANMAATSFTLYLLFRPQSWPNYARMFCLFTGSGNEFGAPNKMYFAHSFSGDVTNELDGLYMPNPTNKMVTNTWVKYVVKVQPSGAYQKWNATATSDTQARTMGPFRHIRFPGSTSQLIADYAEVICVKEYTSTSTDDDVFAYFDAKWGL